MKHIEFAKLIEKYEGRLSANEESKIADHLLVCPQCKISADKLAVFFNYLKPLETEEVPQYITANLLNIYQVKKKTVEGTSVFKRLIGNLVFDDWKLAFNERLAFVDTRQMLYRAETFDIDLRFHFIEGKCKVSGQIFPDVKNKGIVKITAQNQIKSTELNEHCEFVFPPISEGVYDLQITLDNISIELPNISILQ